jgi:hypothetical protein
MNRSVQYEHPMGKKQNLTVQAERGHWDGKRSIILEGGESTRNRRLDAVPICSGTGALESEEAIARRSREAVARMQAFAWQKGNNP